MTWQQNAACRVPPCRNPDCRHRDIGCPEVRALRSSDRLFFGNADGQQDIAVKVCIDCPVWEDCLRDAAKHPESWRYGVRGGLKDTERGLLPGARGRMPGPTDVEDAFAQARLRRAGGTPRSRRTRSEGSFPQASLVVAGMA